MASPITPDTYIASFPADVRERLERVRATIRRAAPKAEELISYGIVGYKLDGMLLYFAGFTGHIGLYPITAAVKEALAEELAGYKTSKGGIRIPHDKRLPTGLIARIVRLRRKENEARAVGKRAKP